MRGGECGRGGMVKDRASGMLVGECSDVQLRVGGSRSVTGGGGRRWRGAPPEGEGDGAAVPDVAGADVRDAELAAAVLRLLQCLDTQLQGRGQQRWRSLSSGQSQRQHGLAACSAGQQQGAAAAGSRRRDR
jgi:hypothetical protein